MINLAITGINGKMGSEILKAANKVQNIKVVAGTKRELNHTQKGLDKNINIGNSLEKINYFNVAIDFTSPESTIDNIKNCIKLQKPIVIGTTGFTDEQLDFIKESSKQIPILLSSNMSLGVNLINKILKIAAKTLDDSWNTKISEIHHIEKKDSPSGTALSMGKIIAKVLNYKFSTKEELLSSPIDFQSERIGDVKGEHTVTFENESELISFKHLAKDRSIFAKGAIKAAEWIYDKPPGLYSMDDVIDM